MTNSEIVMTTLFITAIIIVLRLNLPPKDMRISTIQFVAQWKFYDFIIFKIACSAGNDLILIGLPFCKWKLIKM